MMSYLAFVLYKLNCIYTNCKKQANREKLLICLETKISELCLALFFSLFF